MALSPKERTELEQDIQRIKTDIRNKEDILASYYQEPSMKRHLPGLTKEITGLKLRLQWLQDALKKG